MLEEIGRQAEEMNADLVVLGARGSGFMRHVALGTTAERLLRKSKHPMLVVKQRAHEPYRRVLAAVDFSQWSAPLIGLARRVAPGAHLVLLHAYEGPFERMLQFASVDEATIAHYRLQARQEATQQIHALVASAGLEAAHRTPCIRHGEASLAVVEQEQEQEQDCNLIIIGKHGRNMAEELLLGSVTKHVLAESAGDVLVSTERRA